MSSTAIYRARRAPPPLDFALLRQFFLYFFVLCVIIAPFTPDPLAWAGGAAVPCILLSLVGTASMPAAVAYLFLWQWVQIFARALQMLVDGEAMNASFSGPNVGRAYWYMLASLIVMALAFRAVLGNLKPPTQAQRTAHYHWNVRDLITFYIATLVISVFSDLASRFVPALGQPFGAVGLMKIIGLFMLFVYVMSTGRGTKFLIGVVAFEILIGFTGFLSDFRSVFIFLAMAAIAARVRMTGSVTAATFAAAGTVIALALFWTSVKGDYQQFAAQSSESQEIKTGLSERMSYLGGKALSSGNLSVGDSAYMLLRRLAYTDIFASVIDVQDLAPEIIPMRQWSEGIGHVLMPRFLFPGKPPLSDSDVYTRLTRRYLTEEIRAGTSISVGYMGENYADLAFPGMLAGVGLLGLLLAGLVRLVMMFKLPLVMREGIVMGLAFNMSRDGVEVSLPKILGAMFMFFLVYLLLNKFFFPKVVAWLDKRSAMGRMRRA